MNSEGEKIPPEEPDPKLSEVAKRLADAQQSQQPKRRDPSCQHRLDRCVADAVDVVLAEGAEEEVHEHAKHRHPKHVP